MPKARAGHCQLNLGNGQIFIFGGFSFIDKHNSNNYDNILHDNEAWIWNHDKWSMVTTASPCPPSRQPVTILQQCVMKGIHEIIIITQNFNDFTSCTSILTIASFEWTKITSNKDHTLPIGGFLLTGIDFNNTCIFYLGGFGRSNNQSVFELADQWMLTTMKLPFGITAWNSLISDSKLNFTDCKSDVHHWPHE